MLEEEILNSVWRKCTDSIFSGKTYSNKRPGFNINFRPPNIMNIRGGNLGLPNFILLQLSGKVKYFYDHDRFFQKRSNNKDDLRMLDKLDKMKMSETELDRNWQILRLLDPRVLLEKGTYQIWGSESVEKFDKITIEHDLSKLHNDGILKINGSS